MGAVQTPDEVPTALFMQGLDDWLNEKEERWLEQEMAKKSLFEKSFSELEATERAAIFMI